MHVELGFTPATGNSFDQLYKPYKQRLVGNLNRRSDRSRGELRSLMAQKLFQHS